MKKHNQKLIPNCLRKYRKARGLKQAEVAKILGLNNTGMISRWEQGCCLPSTLNLLCLAIVYRTMPDALFAELIRNLRSELLKREEEMLEISKR